MKKQKLLAWGALGFSIAQVVTACGGTDRADRRDVAGAGGASDGGASVLGGQLGAGKGPETGGAGDAGARSDGGAPGSGGSSLEPSAGASEMAGGGALSGGSGGSLEQAAGARGGSVGELAEAGSGGESGAGLRGDAGAGGSGDVPIAKCGDGVLVPGESCCTPEWRDTQLSLATRILGAALVGLEGCIPEDQPLVGVSVCGSATCAGGATGCATEVTAATLEYSPEDQTITGTVDLVIRGRVSHELLGGCNFTANIDDSTYEADVITRVTPETLHVRLGAPDLGYGVQVAGCGSLSTVAELLLANPIARAAIEAPIRRELQDRLQFDLACPY